MVGRNGSLYEAFDIMEDLQATIRYCRTKVFRDQLYDCMRNILIIAKEIAQDGEQEDPVYSTSSYVSE